MNELSEIEVRAVAGAGDVADAAQAGGAIGAAAGASYAISSGATGTAVLGAAGIGAAALGGIAAAGAVGWTVGNWLNDNTKIQEHISNGLETIGEMTGGSGGATGKSNLIERLWQ